MVESESPHSGFKVEVEFGVLTFDLLEQIDDNNRLLLSFARQIKPDYSLLLTHNLHPLKVLLDLVEPGISQD